MLEHLGPQLAFSEGSPYRWHYHWYYRLPMVTFVTFPEEHIIRHFGERNKISTEMSGVKSTGFQIQAWLTHTIPFFMQTEDQLWVIKTIMYTKTRQINISIQVNKIHWILPPFGTSSNSSSWSSIGINFHANVKIMKQPHCQPNIS